MVVFSFSAQAKVGDPCQSDADCKGGVCLDTHEAADHCQGKICTIPCKVNEDCPKEVGKPDCDPVKGKMYCLYDEWSQRFCKMK